MLIMTAKVNKRNLLIGLIAVIAAIFALIFLVGSDADPTGPSKNTTVLMDTNDARVKYLNDLGWEVTTSPTESMQVRIPKDSNQVFDRYNELQKSQGFDLSKHAGKTVMRYVYQINNFPNATQPVYVTLLVYRDELIGGDITDSGPGGKVLGLKHADSLKP